MNDTNAVPATDAEIVALMRDNNNDEGVTLRLLAKMHLEGESESCVFVLKT